MSAPGSSATEATARLVLHLDAPAIANFSTPTVALNGAPVPTALGENVFPVAPGPTTVSVECEGLWTHRHAEETVSIAPGQTAHLWYAAPYLSTFAGSIGPDKQKHRGLLLLAVVLAPPIVVTIISLFVALLTADD